MPSALLEPELDVRRAPRAPALARTDQAGFAPAPPSIAQIATLGEVQRAGAVANLQRASGNAAIARRLGAGAEAGVARAGVAEAGAPEPGRGRPGERCSCGGTIGADGLCDRCRAALTDGPAAAEGEAAGDAALMRLIADRASVQRQEAAAETGGRDGAEAPADAACTTRCGGIPGDCPPPFCCPYPTGTAYLIREQIRTPFLAAIATKVTPAVVPVWLMWFQGGTSTQNFSGRYGTDFTNDPSTDAVANLLARQLRGLLDATRIAALAASTPPGRSVSLLPALPPDYLPARRTELESDSSPLLMDFTTIGTVPGNLAGGVGKTQTTCSVGAQPGPIDDLRSLTDVQATIVRNANGSVTVTPTFHFRIADTVDLCPGNCGSGLGMINEQMATYPMSRLEASGVSGDVPFTVDFPSLLQAPIVLPPPAPPVPTHVTFSASVLFDYGRHELKSGGEEALVAELGDRPSHADLTQPFVVEGHTDAKGGDAFNQGLSERRAQTVVDVLERRYPNLLGHLAPLGFGESRPVAPNEVGGQDNPAGRELNRRVELRFAAPPAGP